MRDNDLRIKDLVFLYTIIQILSLTAKTLLHRYINNVWNTGEKESL